MTDPLPSPARPDVNPDSAEASITRRDAFRATVRWTTAAAIGLATGALALRTLDGNAACRTLDTCRACRELGGCGRPEAIAFRQTQRSRDEGP